MNDAGTPTRCAGLRRYVALGSSSTAGAGASGPGASYVALLTAALQEDAPELELSNFGAGGARIGRFLDDLDAILALEPDVVTILPFTDLVQTPVAELETGYSTLFSSFAPSGAEVFVGVLTVDPALICGTGSGPGGCYGQADADLLAQKRAALAALAAPYATIHIVDVPDPNVAHPEYNAADGHPNDLGHRYLASSLWGPMRATLSCSVDLPPP